MRGPLIGGDVGGDIGVGSLEVVSVQSGETIFDSLFHSNSAQIGRAELECFPF